MKPIPQKKQIGKRKRKRRSKQKCQNCAAVVAATSSKKRNKRFKFKACLKSENSQKTSQIEANLAPVITDEPKIINFFPSELPMVRYFLSLRYNFGHGQIWWWKDSKHNS